MWLWRVDCFDLPLWLAWEHSQPLRLAGGDLAADTACRNTPTQHCFTTWQQLQEHGLLCNCLVTCGSSCSGMRTWVMLCLLVNVLHCSCCGAATRPTCDLVCLQMCMSVQGACRTAVRRFPRQLVWCAVLFCL